MREPKFKRGDVVKHRKSTAIKIKRSPWLTKSGPAKFAVWSDLEGNEWLCCLRLKDWFNIPKSAETIRLVVSRERNSKDSYRVVRRSNGQSILVETALGNHWALLHWKLSDFLRTGDWISIEYKEI